MKLGSELLLLCICVEKHKQKYQNKHGDLNKRGFVACVCVMVKGIISHFGEMGNEEFLHLEMFIEPVLQLYIFKNFSNVQSATQILLKLLPQGPILSSF